MIFDCFPFLREWECLEIRVRELANVAGGPVVHIPVESNVTFQGGYRDQVLTQEALWQHLGALSDKVSPVWLEDEPAGYPGAASVAFAREARQFAAAVQHIGLFHYRSPSDLVMISAADEIPRASAVERAGRDLTDWGQPGDSVIFGMRLYYYWLNCRSSAQPWWGTRMARLGDLQSGAFWDGGSLHKLRLSASGVRYPNAGWHFSYLVGAAPDAVERIQCKLGSYAHAQYNQPPFTDPAHIERCINDGLDLFSRGDTYTWVPVDDTYPQCLRLNTGGGGQYAPFVWPGPRFVWPGPRKEGSL